MKIIFNRLDLPEEDKEKPIDELLNYFNDYWRDEYGISTMLFCRCEEIYFEDDNGNRFYYKNRYGGNGFWVNNKLKRSREKHRLTDKKEANAQVKKFMDAQPINKDE